MSFVIGQSDYFGFGFTTLIKNRSIPQGHAVIEAFEFPKGRVQGVHTPSPPSGHQSVVPFLSGALPPIKKNPGSPLKGETVNRKIMFKSELSVVFI